MNALIIVAHGSRNKESARQVAALCQKLSDKAKRLGDEHECGLKFDRVAHAFLEFSSPGLEETIEDLVQGGVQKIIVFPFFIAAGSHLLTDIPEAIEAARKTYPGVEFSITRHLGGITAIEEIILSEVMTQLNQE